MRLSLWSVRNLELLLKREVLVCASRGVRRNSAKMYDLAWHLIAHTAFVAGIEIAESLGSITQHFVTVSGVDPARTSHNQEPTVL